MTRYLIVRPGRAAEAPIVVFEVNTRPPTDHDGGGNLIVGRIDLMAESFELYVNRADRRRIALALL